MREVEVPMKQPFLITSVLAATDVSPSSIPALRFARLFADRFSAKLTVMYSDPIIYPVDYIGPAHGLYINTSAEHQTELRKEVEDHVAPVMAGRPYELHVTVGQPVAMVLATAKERKADLIVTGTHLRHGWRRAVLGSVSEGVLHGAQCPVLTVGAKDGYVGAPPYAITNILCPVNFTEVARNSLRVAVGLAEAFGAQLTVVHVLEPGEVPTQADDEERIRRWIDPDLQEVCSFRELIVRGGAAERVLDCADDVGADFLVIGAQHKLFRDASVVGTTTERLTRFASCPVLIVPRQAVRHHARVEAEKELAMV